MASLTPTPKQQIYGSDGNPLVGGKIYTYSAGTTTPLATFTDAGGLTANTNPIILNSLGQANIWLAPSSSYKFSVFTSADVLLYTVDNITAPIDYLSLVTSLASPPPIGSTAPNTGAFTTLAATTATVTTGNITTVNATTITATGTVTAETLTFEGGGSMTKPPESAIQPITASVAANALTITLNPITLDFRSATLTSGTVVSRLISTAITITVPSGATLGTYSAAQSRIVVLALDNAGAVELAVVNVGGGNDLSETGVISTAAIAAGSNSISTIYSTTARTSVAYRVVGYIESTQATAGTWVTAPSNIQGQGGLVVPGSLIKSGALTATTSGTSIDFTDIPVWVKRITVMFSGVSTNGTSLIQVQIGDSGGVETTSYFSGAWTANTNSANSTTGFIIHGANASASRVWDGAYTLVLQDTASTWVFTGMCNSLNDNAQSIGIGRKQLSSSPLDRVRITTVNGTDTFDLGSVNILWE